LLWKKIIHLENKNKLRSCITWFCYSFTVVMLDFERRVCSINFNHRLKINNTLFSIKFVSTNPPTLGILNFCHEGGRQVYEAYQFCCWLELWSEIFEPSVFAGNVFAYSPGRIKFPRSSEPSFFLNQFSFP